MPEDLVIDRPRLPTVEDALALGLTRGEYELVCEKLRRAPNRLELAVFSLLWSEHCAYKHSRRWAGAGDRSRGPQARTPSADRRIDSNSFSPSLEPVSGSTACSGWGINPNTFPASFITPATSRAEPLKLCPGA